MKPDSPVNFLSDAIQAGAGWLIRRYPGQTAAAAAIGLSCWLSSLQPLPWFGG